MQPVKTLRLAEFPATPLVLPFHNFMPKIVPEPVKATLDSIL